MQLNDKVRALRKLHDFSQEEMAAKLGMSTYGYAKIERGIRRLDIPKLNEIAAIFEMDLVELLNFDVEKTMNLIHENKQSIIYHYQINKDSSQNTYIGASELEHEIEKLQLTIAHLNEKLTEKEQQIQQITAQKDREIALLQDLVHTLKTTLNT